jgi:hypothetical protein
MSHPAVDVVKTIPGGLRRQVASKVVSLLEDIVSRPQEEAPYVRFFLFPRAVLRNLPMEMRPSRRKRVWRAQLTFTATCLQQWDSSDITRDALIRSVLEQPIPEPRDRSDMERSNLKRCERIAREDG